MDYIRFNDEVAGSVIRNNVEPSVSGIFDGNVSIFEVVSDELVYPTGYFHSEKYGDTAWVDVLKEYQREDGSPLELHLNARIYNSGTSIAKLLYAVRYKEGGSWILPAKSIRISPDSYEDVELSFTPDYNNLTTIIDSYIYAEAGSNGAIVEFGNWDLYVNDVKSRNPKPYIDSRNIKSGIKLEQLEPTL